MVDCVYLLCVFDVFLSAASGKEKVKKFREKETEKKSSKVVLLWTETGENSRLSLRECGYFWHPFTRVRY